MCITVVIKLVKKNAILFQKYAFNIDMGIFHTLMIKSFASAEGRKLPSIQIKQWMNQQSTVNNEYCSVFLVPRLANF